MPTKSENNPNNHLKTKAASFSIANTTNKRQTPTKTTTTNDRHPTETTNKRKT